MAPRRGRTRTVSDDAYAPATPIVLLGAIASLVRELVWADAEIERLAVSKAGWAHLQRWAAYRERLANWRYWQIRGNPNPWLVVCPHCGRITEARLDHWVHFHSFKRGRTYCSLCARMYDASGVFYE